MEKPEIIYPANWSYRVVGEIKKEALLKYISKLVPDKKFQLDLSQKSKTGKYTSFNLSLTVSSEEERLSIFENLKKIKEIKMIL